MATRLLILGSQALPANASISFAQSNSQARIMNTIPISEKNIGGPEFALDVRQFVLESFPRARKQQIKNSDGLIESGIIDSQGVLEVVAFIERKFSTVVEDEELVPENFQTIDRIAAFIRTKTCLPNLGSGMK